MRKLKPIISIIVPIYNGSRHIENLLNSLFSLSYRDFEVIIVNDGSTDDTLYKLETHIYEKLRYRIINQQNQGVASARNTGIMNAKGDWLFFLDVDDLITSNYFDFVDSINISSECKKFPLLLIDGVVDDFGGKEIKWEKTDIKKINHDNVDFALNSKIMRYVWGKLYRRDYILEKSIFFEKYKVAEDFLFNIRLCVEGIEIKVINSGDYKYNQNVTSVTKSYTADNLLSRLSVVLRIKDILPQDNGQKIKKLYMEFFLYQTLKHLNKTTEVDKSKILLGIKKSLNYLSIVQIPYLPLKIKGKIYFLILIIKYRLWR